MTFTVYGDPVPQGRPRFGNGRTYDPPKSRRYKQDVAVAASAAMRGRAPLQGALACSLRFYMPIPKNVSQKRRQELTGRFTTKRTGDIENLAKGVMDAVNGIVWQDDSQVVQLNIEKRYGHVPRVEKKVEPAFEGLR